MCKVQHEILGEWAQIACQGMVARDEHMAKVK
jgi:hypothetical protein